MEGAYSSLACRKLFKQPEILYFKDFEGVFRSVHAPRADGVCVMSEAAFKCAFSAQTEKAAGGCKEG